MATGRDGAGEAAQQERAASICSPAMADADGADKGSFPRGRFGPALARLRRLLAPRCIVCDLEEGDPLCPGCARDYFTADAPRCPTCALRLPAARGEERCGNCLRSPPGFDGTVALADYAPPVDRMIAALKFGGRLPLAESFGRLLARAARQALQDADAVCPVPLAFERQSERGFNQAQEIARRVAADSGRRLRTDILLRIRHTSAQMDLALDERRRNVRGAFVARGDVSGMRVAVVDDVKTTGATLDEVAAALKSAGAARVTNLVVSRTP
jgi:ComF family protein